MVVPLARDVAGVACLVVVVVVGVAVLVEAKCGAKHSAEFHDWQKEEEDDDAREAGSKAGIVRALPTSQASQLPVQ